MLRGWSHFHQIRLVLAQALPPDTAGCRAQI
jgi:hypothetical protein